MSLLFSMPHIYLSSFSHKYSSSFTPPCCIFYSFLLIHPPLSDHSIYTSDILRLEADLATIYFFHLFLSLSYSLLHISHHLLVHMLISDHFFNICFDLLIFVTVLFQSFPFQFYFSSHFISIFSFTFFFIFLSIIFLSLCDFLFLFLCFIFFWFISSFFHLYLILNSTCLITSSSTHTSLGSLYLHTLMLSFFLYFSHTLLHTSYLYLYTPRPFLSFFLFLILYSTHPSLIIHTTHLNARGRRGRRITRERQRVRVS